MLGSNPSADSVASTDPGGCCAIPLSSVCRHRARIGRGTKAQNPGGAGAKPLRHSLLPLRKPASSHNACVRDLSTTEKDEAVSSPQKDNCAQRAKGR
jgi:hypothetical protein